MHPPRYHELTYPDERVLRAIADRITRVRDQRGWRVATRLAAQALAAIDAELPELLPERRLLPPHRTETPTGRLRRRRPIHTVEG